jgi:hypothetical protein
MISQGVVGAQTDPGVEDDVDSDSGSQVGLPPAAPVDTNPLNAGGAGAGAGGAAAGAGAGTGLPPAAPVDATGLPQTGSGGYLDTGSSNSTFYMLVSVVAMMGLAGSLVYARARSK